MTSACFVMVLPMPTLILPLVGDSIVTQSLCQLRDESAKVARRRLCGRRSPLIQLFTMLRTDHGVLDNDVIRYFVFNFQISPACNFTFSYLNWGETRSARVDRASRVHQLLLHNKLPSEDSTDHISKQQEAHGPHRSPE
jgi:hypothetical protein